MKRDDMLDFMGGIDDKYLDEAGEMRMNSVVDATGRSKSIKRRSMIMSLKKLSIVAAALALLFGPMSIQPANAQVMIQEKEEKEVEEEKVEEEFENTNMLSQCVEFPTIFSIVSY